MPKYSVEIDVREGQTLGQSGQGNSVYAQEITNEEAYWCGVGTIGADVVFALGGSFLYGALCGAVAL